jgi:hypothetical protein
MHDGPPSAQRHGPRAPSHVDHSQGKSDFVGQTVESKGLGHAEDQQTAQAERFVAMHGAGGEAAHGMLQLRRVDRQIAGQAAVTPHLGRCTYMGDVQVARTQLQRKRHGPVGGCNA